MESYLSNRKQCVEIDDSVSDMLDLTTGVQNWHLKGPNSGSTVVYCSVPLTPQHQEHEHKLVLKQLTTQKQCILCEL